MCINYLFLDFNHPYKNLQGLSYTGKRIFLYFPLKIIKETKEHIIKYNALLLVFFFFNFPTDRINRFIKINSNNNEIFFQYNIKI